MKKERWAVEVAVQEEAPELIVDREVKSPQPLDRRIASVWMWTPTNNPTDGYDLMLSASFGKERVILKGDGFEIDVDFGITSADIEVEGYRCSTAIVEEGRGEVARTTIKDQTSHFTKYKLAAGGEVFSIAATGGSAKGKLGGSYEKSGSHVLTAQRQVSRLDYHRIDSNTIQVGPSDEPLNGPLIQDFKGWRVTPGQKTVPSAVIARLKVREGWI